MTRWENKCGQIDHNEIRKWLYEEVGIPENTPIELKGCDTNPALVEILDIKMSLGIIQKGKILDRFPELIDNEVVP